MSHEKDLNVSYDPAMDPNAMELDHANKIHSSSVEEYDQDLKEKDPEANLQTRTAVDEVDDDLLLREAEELEAKLACECRLRSVPDRRRSGAAES